MPMNEQQLTSPECNGRTDLAVVPTQEIRGAEEAGIWQ